jgi:hypothetical protein
MSATSVQVRAALAAAVTFSTWAVLLQADQNDNDINHLPAILTAKPLKSTPKDDALQKRFKEVYNIRQELTADYYKELIGGRVSVDVLLDSARRLQQTGMEISQGHKEKIELLEQMTKLSNKAGAILDSWNVTSDEQAKRVKLQRSKLREFKLEVEIEILKVKNAAKGGGR